MPDTTPFTVTVFGSCCVVTPCQILNSEGKLKLNQRNIFGFTHHPAETYQQFQLITGSLSAPKRLWPYLNISKTWNAPDSGNIDNFHENFKDTDIFIVEVSSVRKVVYKAFLLQINRTREILAKSPEDVKNWWEPMTRFGVNNAAKIPGSLTGNDRDVAELVNVVEQDTVGVYRDIARIDSFLKKPVIYVSHFDTDRQKKPIPQRTRINEALKKLKKPESVLDPTQLVQDAGIDEALLDLGHYRKEFEPEVAKLLYSKILARL
ncbi:hypothetical protein [Roseixanthobacter glucoisosaccharinicivorans]|uniref:hypothetical protein n=1 Tax=Roseixanthobacter glucoisosaccharinicivorans TaxID=3119923 RepID=UPI00372AC5D3